MARKNRGRRMPKIEPAVTQLLYMVPDGTSYIDLAKDLSMINRRLYRQGMSYVVQDVQFGIGIGMRASDVTSLTFSVAGNSWIVHNAWKKAFNVWREQQKKVTDALPGTQGKYADFKVYLDDTMEDGTILTPFAGDGANYTGGDWDHSRFVFDDDGTERHFKMHLIGTTNLTDTNAESAIGLIHEYSHSRPNVHISSPDVEAELSDTIYAKLLGTDEMSDILVDQVETFNDVPPYDQDEFPGGETNADAAVPVRFGSVSGTQTTTSLGGFVAQCGLIKVYNSLSQLSINPGVHMETNAGATTDHPGPLSIYAATTGVTTPIIITLAPGPYRGVLAAPMGQ